MTCLLVAVLLSLPSSDEAVKERRHAAVEASRQPSPAIVELDATAFIFCILALTAQCPLAHVPWHAWPPHAQRPQTIVPRHAQAAATGSAECNVRSPRGVPDASAGGEQHAASKAASVRAQHRREHRPSYSTISTTSHAPQSTSCTSHLRTACHRGQMRVEACCCLPKQQQGPPTGTRTTAVKDTRGGNRCSGALPSGRAHIVQEMQLGSLANSTVRVAGRQS